MNKNIGIIVGFIIVVLVGAGIYASTNKKDGAMMLKDESALNDKTIVQEEATESEVMMKKEELDATQKENKDTSMMKKEDVMMKAGSYEAYSPEKIAKAENGNVVLFFRAGWCPTCISLDKDIKANLGKISSDLTILDVNYDDSSDLKKKYGVTYQHTLVQVDKDGNLIKKWSGSPTLAKLTSEVK